MRTSSTKRTLHWVAALSALLLVGVAARADRQIVILKPGQEDRKQKDKKQKPDSLEVEVLKGVERHFGTVAAGVCVILGGLYAAGQGVWVIRPVFRSDCNLWYKVGVVLLILVGLGMASAGVAIARHGATGQSLSSWLGEG